MNVSAVCVLHSLIRLVFAAESYTVALRGSFGGYYHLVFTPPETRGLNTDLDFYCLKDTQRNGI